jgi:hypothetical protein
MQQVLRLSVHRGMHIVIGTHLLGSHLSDYRIVDHASYVLVHQYQEAD